MRLTRETISGWGRVAGWACAVLATASVAGAAPLPANLPAILGATTYAHPGRMVRLADGRRINLRCMGHGSPTVLLESGFGANSSAWNKVQPRIAATTRVCAYDRAGYGFSDPGPLPRDGAAIARDLDRALRAARISGPFVLVGHSAGGLYMRLFAGRRLKEVTGLVFVDSSVPYQDRKLAAAFGPGAGSVEGVRRRVQRCLDATTLPRAKTVAATLEECVPKNGDARARLVALRFTSWRMQLSEIDTLFNATSDEVDRMGAILKDVPAIVLTAVQTDGPAGDAPPSAAVWQGMHRELAAGFLHGEQRNVKSGHLMMNERPDAVVGATLELVEASRRAARPH